MDNSADSDRKARRKKVEQPQEGSDDQGMKADGDMSAIADPGHKPLIGEARIDATIDRVAEELFSREQTRFSAVQAAIWIATGRLDLVEMTGANESIRDSSIIEASLDLERILREFKEAGLDWAKELPESSLLQPAVQKLEQACLSGKVTMLGRLRNQGIHDDIPAKAWTGIEIVDDRREGIIAAPPDRHRPGVMWWGALTLRREQVQHHWRERNATAPTAVKGESVKIWMAGQIVDRRNKGQTPDQPTMVIAAVDNFRKQGLTERHARKLYSELDSSLKGKRGPKGPRISRQKG